MKRKIANLIKRLWNLVKKIMSPTIEINVEVIINISNNHDHKD